MGSRLADRSAGVGAQRGGCLAGGDGRRRPSRRAARNAGRVPGVAADAKSAGLVGGAHRELVLVQLAQQHRAAIAQFFPGGGAVGRDKIVKDARPAGRADPFGQEDVFQRQRNSGQHVHVARRDATVGRFGPSQRLLRCDRDERADLGLHRLYSRQHGFGRLDRG